ncbi:MAG: protoporphyrinogen/coproporphyrinogen oxidase, partial [Nocardioidaceae bacterium]|nr:protoporphyrinogen/coproporphyrinogen oxidase [Nocardioidaceae bacterium]
AVRTGVTVRELARTDGGFTVVTGPTTAPERIETDAVVLATPAAPTARLLTEVAPAAARELAEIESASVVVVTLAFRTEDVRGLDDSSGFLVPPVDGRAIKASTFSFAKWGWVREAGAEHGLVHLRTSLGRHGEEATLQRTDEELVAASLADLNEAAGISAAPLATHVQRWGGGLPQYAVGHLDRVARIRAAVAEVPGLVLCGAAYDGVGIPSVIASARAAVAGL